MIGIAAPRGIGLSKLQVAIASIPVTAKAEQAIVVALAIAALAAAIEVQVAIAWETEAFPAAEHLVTQAPLAGEAEGSTGAALAAIVRVVLPV